MFIDIIAHRWRKTVLMRHIDLQTKLVERAAISNRNDHLVSGSSLSRSIGLKFFKDVTLVWHAYQCFSAHFLSVLFCDRS